VIKIGLLSDILMAPLKAPVDGFVFILEQIKNYVDQEMYDESRLQEKLLEARMSFERGRISQEEYSELEAIILDRIKIAHQRQEERIIEAAELEGIDYRGGIQVQIEREEDDS